MSACKYIHVQNRCLSWSFAFLELYKGDSKYQHCKSTTWNPVGNDLLMTDIEFPIIALFDEEQIDFLISEVCVILSLAMCFLSSCFCHIKSIMLPRTVVVLMSANVLKIWLFFKSDDIVCYNNNNNIKDNNKHNDIIILFVHKHTHTHTHTHCTSLYKFCKIKYCCLFSAMRSLTNL